MIVKQICEAEFFLSESMQEKWNFKVYRAKSDRKMTVLIKYLINFVGISMETSIRPVIWLAEFLKMEKILYGTTKLANYGCALYSFQFQGKKLNFF